ncbi:MAG: protein kinase [Kofleriaceae bacterium]
MNRDPDATGSIAPAIVGAPIVMPSLRPQDIIDELAERYIVESTLGAGGMGVVLAARGSDLGRTVAVKLITADREDLRRRFEREARTTARLQHPAIVPVYGRGRISDGRPFYVMKHVSGVHSTRRSPRPRPSPSGSRSCRT